MATIDLALCSKIFEAIWTKNADRWYLWTVIVTLIFLVNTIFYSRVCEKNGYLFVVWKAITMVYITLIFSSLFGIPMIVILEYLEQLDNHHVDVDIVITSWLYIFWIAIVFKILILPTYYIYYCVILEKRGKLHHSTGRPHIELSDTTYNMIK